MKFIDEFRDRKLVGKLAAEIREAVNRRRDFTVMEVCGTHTMAIFRFGLRRLLPDAIRLISGPGCPVCVTPNAYLDKAIAIAKMPNVILTTFGDMMRVPGSRSSLEQERTAGRSVKVVYSTDDALALARKHRDKEVVFLGIGFETTAPTVAASILAAKKLRINNYSVLCGHKTMPEAIKALVDDSEVQVDGFLLPGHVSAIIGARPYEFLAERYGKRCVIAGFEPVDILESILMPIRQPKPAVEIEYDRVAQGAGNRVARRVMERVFTKTNAEWRGLGRIRASGLSIRKELRGFDAERRFRPKVAPSVEPKGCICAAVLKGIRIPPDCRLFGRRCTPSHPVGACMVSGEGACAAYYKYRGAI